MINLVHSLHMTGYRLVFITPLHLHPLDQEHSRGMHSMRLGQVQTKDYQVIRLLLQRLSEASMSSIVQTEVAKRAELGRSRTIYLSPFQPRGLSVKLTGYFEGELSTQWSDDDVSFYFALG